MSQKSQPLVSHPRFRVRFGLLVGFACNMALAIKAWHYMSLPMGSLIYADPTYGFFAWKALLVSVFVGIPLSLWEARRARRGGWNTVVTCVAVALCCATLFTPNWLENYIGNARHLRTHCYPCDGGQDYIDGLYLDN